jgi:thiol-disulfide isomerase/thioredoxin
MTKRVLGLIALGFLIAFGCSRRPMREQVDASLPLTNSLTINLSASIAQAKAENKLVLMDFNGPDWCPPCIEMREKIFSKPDFAAYASSNLVFLSVDFPQKYRLPPEASATNDLLSAQFGAEGVPVLVALNGDGKEVWRHRGLFDGGAKELENELDAARSKPK